MNQKNFENNQSVIIPLGSLLFFVLGCRLAGKQVFQSLPLVVFFIFAFVFITVVAGIIVFVKIRDKSK